MDKRNLTTAMLTLVILGTTMLCWNRLEPTAANASPVAHPPPRLMPNLWTEHFGLTSMEDQFESWAAEWPMFRNDPNLDGCMQCSPYFTPPSDKTYDGVDVRRWTYNGVAIQGKSRGSGHSGPAIVGNRIYVGTVDGALICLEDKGDQAVPAWPDPYPVSGSVSGVAVDGHLIYVTTKSGNDIELICLEDMGTSASYKWTFQLNVPGVSLSFSDPVIARDKNGNKRVYLSSKKSIYCVDSSGKQVWGEPPGLEEYFPLVGSPSVSSFDGNVYIGCVGGCVACYDSVDGDAVMWPQKIDYSPDPMHDEVIMTDLAIDREGYVYMGAERYRALGQTGSRKFVECFKNVDGVATCVWGTELEDTSDFTCPALLGSHAWGYLYIGMQSVVYCLDMASGTPVWYSHFESQSTIPMSPPVVADVQGYVYIGRDNGGLYCYNNFGEGEVEPKWGYVIDKSHEFSWRYCIPVIACGRVYVIADNQNLYCFGYPQHDAPPFPIPLRSVLYRGFPCNLSVGIVNIGSYQEALSVMFYAGTGGNDTLLGQESDITLPSWMYTIVTLQLNSTDFGFQYGHYNITAKVSPVLGQNDTARNTVSIGYLPLTIPGDVDGSSNVNILDISKVAHAFGVKQDDPRYYPDGDINNDGKIDIIDISICGKYFGQKLP